MADTVLKGIAVTKKDAKQELCQLVTDIAGIIFARSDGSAINNATIEILELAKTTTSNTIGEYQFKPILNGIYTVHLTKAGY